MNRSTSEPPRPTNKIVVKQEYHDDSNSKETTLNDKRSMKRYARCQTAQPQSDLKKRLHQSFLGKHFNKKIKIDLTDDFPIRQHSANTMSSFKTNTRFRAASEASFFIARKEKMEKSLRLKKKMFSSPRATSSIRSNSSVSSRSMSARSNIRGSTTSIAYARPSGSLLRAAMNQTPPNPPSLNTCSNSRTLSPSSGRLGRRSNPVQNTNIRMKIEYYPEDKPYIKASREFEIKGRGSEGHLMAEMQKKVDYFKTALDKHLKK